MGFDFLDRFCGVRKRCFLLWTFPLRDRASEVRPLVDSAADGVRQTGPGFEVYYGFITVAGEFLELWRQKGIS